MLKKELTSLFVRSLWFAGAAAIVTACGGTGTSQSPLPLPQQATTDPGAGRTPMSTTSQFSVVQTKHAGSTYNSTLPVRLSTAPAAGDVLVLFFEVNKPFSFPHSGQVTWPTAETGTQWSYDGSVNSTAVFHHVVQAGETGSYTLNVGGAGSGWADYMVAEVRGASTTNPVNNRLVHAVASGTTQFTLGSGLAPTTAGTFPVAFFGPHQNGLTWQSVSSGWTIAARNADYSEMLATGPVQTGTIAVTATATLSTKSGNAGAADIVLLNPASGSTGSTGSATPTPAPSSNPVSTPAPTPVPTSQPVASTGYRYHGCPLYTANDWFTTNLVQGGSSYVPSSVDANSAAIIKNLSTALGSINFAGNVDAKAAIVNIDNETNQIAKPQISGLSYGFGTDPYGDDPSPHTMPVTSGTYYQEGTSGCNGDCHVNVLDTVKCVEFETYNSGSASWNGSTYTAVGGGVENLNHPFNIEPITVTAGDLPNMGTTDWGEDASLSSIPHIVAFYLPQPHTAVGGYVAPSYYGLGCSSYCTNKLPYGARLRLHSSYACPSASSYPQANLICNQLKNYGMIFNDSVGVDHTAGIRLGLSSNGTNPWHSTDYNQFLSNVKITDFDVMTLGTVHG